MNILLVDDEKTVVKGLKHTFLKEGFNVLTAYNGKESLDIVRRERVDFIILDLMLPVIDGMTVCRKVREDMDTPIIMLSEKDDYADKVMCLELGADDYVTKPFYTRELLARVKTILRRTGWSRKARDASKEIVEVDNLKVNFFEKNVYKSGREVLLTVKEFDILALLMRNKGRVFSRDELFELVWKEDGCDTRTVDVHISRLREKIEDKSSEPQYIKTKWGRGYFFGKAM